MLMMLHSTLAAPRVLPTDDVTAEALLVADYPNLPCWLRGAANAGKFQMDSCADLCRWVSKELEGALQVIAN
jgi:hypothetical protein